MIGLGGRCQVSHQLRRKFPGYQAQFFDWLITPDAALVKILEAGMAGFPDDLEFKIGQSNKPGIKQMHVVDGAYGTALLHEFEHEEAGPARQWATSKGKFEKLTARFHETVQSGGRVLFVRMSFGNPGTFGYDLEDRANGELGQKISAAIERHWPNLDYKLLMISHKAEDVGQEGRVEVVHLPEQIYWIWTGKDAAWDAILDQRVRVG